MTDPLPVCSRAGCAAGPTYRLLWRNPRIHDATRTKVWLACDEHVEHLGSFLRARAFPVEVARFDRGTVAE